MEYNTIKEAAEKRNLSVRRVQTICYEGMIQGTIKFGHAWAIRLLDKTENRQTMSSLYQIRHLKKEKDIKGDIIISTIQKLFSVLTG